MQCSSCGYANDVPTTECVQCGDALTPNTCGGPAVPKLSSTDVADGTVHDPRAQLAADAPATPENHRPQGLPPVVVGEVNGLRQRVEPAPGGRLQWQIWTFKLDVYNEHGRLTDRYAVELRDCELRGVLHDGDLVEVGTRRWRDDVLTPRQIRNLTTESFVGTNLRTRVGRVVFSVTVLVLLVLAARALSSFASGGAPGFPTSAYRCFDERARLSRLQSQIGFDKQTAQEAPEFAKEIAAGARRRAVSLERELNDASAALAACDASR